MLALLFTCVFINIDSEHWWALRSGALKVSDVVEGLIEQGLTNAAPQLSAVSTSLRFPEFRPLIMSTLECCCWRLHKAQGDYLAVIASGLS